MNGYVLLRCLAGLLIVNSHLEDLYPIRQLAADGLLGNTLFLLLSGYGLASSELKTHHSARQWYARRLRRIYPAVFLVIFFGNYLIGGGWRTWGAADYIRYFIFAGGPTRGYYFVFVILVYYLFYYWFVRTRNPRLLGWASLALCAPYLAIPYVGRNEVIYYGFYWIFYFQVMLFGGWLAYRGRPIEAGRWREVVLLLGVASVYLALRFAAMPGRYERWFFTPALAGVAVCYLLFRLSAPGGLLTSLLEQRWIARVSALVGGATLELYLLHFHIIRFPPFARCVFPVNVVVVLTVSIAAACALSSAIAVVGAWAIRSHAERRTAQGVLPSV